MNQDPRIRLGWGAFCPRSFQKNLVPQRYPQKRSLSQSIFIKLDTWIWSIWRIPVRLATTPRRSHQPSHAPACMARTPNSQSWSSCLLKILGASGSMDPRRTSSISHGGVICCFPAKHQTSIKCDCFMDISRLSYGVRLICTMFWIQFRIFIHWSCGITGAAVLCQNFGSIVKSTQATHPALWKMANLKPIKEYLAAEAKAGRYKPVWDFPYTT